MKKNFLLLAAGFLCFNLISFRASAQKSTPRIVVGIAYVSQPCNGITITSAKGFQYISGNSRELKVMMDSVTQRVMRKHEIEKKNVVVKFASMPYAVIIRYEKKISGWNCKKTIYGVGFGNSAEAAEQAAIKAKESKDAHTVVETIRAI